MNVIDQNSILDSQEQWLVPLPSLIDGRTERDRLWFLSEFASLINFYDGTNKLTGNWQPFLLKDPVFLLAYISKAPFKKWHTLYLNTCLKLERMADLSLVPQTNPAPDDLGDSVNELFDQLMHVFMQIERWTYFMQLESDPSANYDLKNYVLHKTENDFSKYLWALLSMRDAMFMQSAYIPGIDAPVYDVYDGWNETIWKQSMNKIPYWDVLELKQELNTNTAEEIFKSLRSAGDKLFGFFHTIVEHAGREFPKIQLQPSIYPDTTLLRAFVDLLRIHQDQLNGISQKHLEFYYRDILKQTKKFAVADTAFIFAELAKPDQTFELAAATLFDAGMDAQKTPVVFETQEAVNLNPAAIANAYTLARRDGADNLSSLYFQKIAAPGILHKNDDGTVQQWETFGGTSSPPELLKSLGIAFASPMLLLREGHRNIVLTLTFKENMEIAMLEKANYFLSTQTAWLPVSVKAEIIVEVEINTSGPVPVPVPRKQAVLRICLESTVAPIEKFLKDPDPDGMSSDWPMFKMEFSSFYSMAVPPVITGLKIDVSVNDVKGLQLYNDNGLLNTKTPFQLFGPVPENGANFIIGSNEIFSKPFDSLSILFDWDTLPDNFFNYYIQYNQYLVENKIVKIDFPGQKTSVGTKVRNAFRKIFGKPALPPKAQKIVPVPVTPPAAVVPEKKSMWKRFTGIFKKAEDKVKAAEDKKKTIDPPPLTPVNPPPLIPKTDPKDEKKIHMPVSTSFFDNFSFTLDFALLEEQSWQNFTIRNEMKKNPVCKIPAEVDPGRLLFSTSYITCQLSNKSVFTYPAPVLPPLPPVAKKADPQIQGTPLVFTDSSASGFMRMTLSNPSYGFGFGLYADVVTDIAMQNAVTLVKLRKKEDKPKFAMPAVLPFVPKLVSITAAYSATQEYDLTTYKDEYPLQCFFYSPFENYPVYNNNVDPAGEPVGTTITGMLWPTGGLPLFPALEYAGVLFLELDNLVPAAAMNFYFELSRNFGDPVADKKIAYYYLSTQGWKELQVLADGTNNLSCPGVITVNVPTDITSDSLVMPGKKSWFSIAVKEDAGAYAKTVFLKTNGFAVQRSGLSFLASTDVPKLNAGIISKTKLPVPQIATIVQPFSSFGGKPAETGFAMNQRVSQRLKTKDRAVSSSDYFSMVREEFPEIYYSKAVFNAETKQTEIYVVKSVESPSDPGAFLPLVSECTEGKIQKFLQDRASVFARIRVANFDMQYVKVKATVTIASGYEQEGVRKNIIAAINTFLSPWIGGSGQKVEIDQGISDAQLATIINNVDGVVVVQQVSFYTYTIELEANQKSRVTEEPSGISITPEKASTLFVPYPTHDIQFDPAT